MGTKQDTLHENIEVLERTALLADWFVGLATNEGDQEAVDRCTHDGEVLRGYSHINETALRLLGSDADDA